MDFKEKIEKLLKTHNIRIMDCGDIGLGFMVEIAEKIIGKEGYNPCVPRNKGKAIYQGRITHRTGKSLEGIINGLVI